MSFLNYSPPNGCLQYHTGIDGRFTTFNYGGTTAQHLRNQDYRICIRQEEGIFGILIWNYLAAINYLLVITDNVSSC